MVNLDNVDMAEVRDHYLMRERFHHRLRNLIEADDADGYVGLALGISEGPGNYSASEHGMGPRILAAAGAQQEVFALATAIDSCVAVNRLPKVIYEHDIANLKISVGSEMAMMLRPDVFWVGNKRTIWSHLLVSQGMNPRPANQALRLYYSRDDDSEMDYPVWRDLYLRVGPDLVTLGERAANVARTQGIEPGGLRYLWPDAVANFLFDRFARH